MRIAYIGQKGIPKTQGGVEAHVENLALEMVRKGHQVFVYTRPYYTDKKLKKYQGINLISLPSIKTKHLDAISHTFLATIHALFQKYDIIHYHSVGPAILSFIPRLFSRAKIIGTFHCIDRFHQKWNFLARIILKLGERAICKFPHLTITVSPHIQKYCLEKYQQKTIYIPNGFKIAKNQETDILKKFNIESQKYFLVVSRLIRHKGLHYIIKAFNKLNLPNYKLVIVGNDFYNPDYKKELYAMSATNKNIIFTGIQTGKNLDKLFTNAKAFILASEDEGLSITLLEALAHKLPAIVSNIESNLPFINKDLVYGFENKDIEDLKEKMSQVIKNYSQAQTRAEQAQKYIQTNFNWPELAEQINNLYLETKKTKKLKTLFQHQD